MTDPIIAGLAHFNQSMEDQGWKYDGKVWHFVGIKPTVQQRLAEMPATTREMVDGIADQFV